MKEKRPKKSQKYNNLNEDEVRELLTGNFGVSEENLFEYIQMHPFAFKVGSMKAKIKSDKKLEQNSVSKNPTI